ncbi:uncharacterized protein B0T15DRAFT_521481 [Chaetomium strumarium]|uniref:JmjC domain-containing protein n=1 Tax=Chaetomium strumarium TaxID=1170767 RepID=A0AAJ0H4L9_9PEZI|nr:hypothetical protein B0T15DRAFT_521481 [Chaetomium strumarium]
MDALQPKVDSITREVGEISSVLRSYLEHGLTYGRKVQPPKTKAGRDLLQHLLGRIDQVSIGLVDICNLAAPRTLPSPPAVHESVKSSSHTPITTQQISDRAEPAKEQAPQVGSVTSSSHTLIPTQQTSAPAEAAKEQTHQVESVTSSSHTPIVIQQNLPCAEPAKEQTPQAENASSDREPTSAHLPLDAEPKSELPTPGATAPSAGTPSPHAAPQASNGIRLSDGSVYQTPVLSEHASPLFDCTYQDIHNLNEELFELYSSHPVVRDRGYFKLQVRELPPLNVQKVARPTKNHATSFTYKADKVGLVKVDTGKRARFSSPKLPLPVTDQIDWSLEEQRRLWNNSAKEPPKGSRPYIIGNPLFEDVELSPGEKLRRRGRAILEGINTQYVYFNLKGKTITTMHREDAHVRSENLLRSGQHKFWCFVKPAFAKKLEERMALEYPEMRRCSQAVRHLSRHIPPEKLDEWGIEYTLDYCAPGQAVVTEPGTYHQVLNLGPNYAIAINLEYKSSPDMPADYRFCNKNCPDKFAISADDFRIYETPPPQPGEEHLPHTPETTCLQERHATVPDAVAPLSPEATVSQPTQSATPLPEKAASDTHNPLESQAVRPAPQLPQETNAEGQEEQLSEEPLKRTESPARPPLPANAVQPQQLQQSHVMSATAPTPGLINTSESGSVEQASPPGQRLPLQEPLPALLEAAATATTQRPDVVMQPQTHLPEAAARSMQIQPQAHPVIQRHPKQGLNSPLVGALPPIRKTARMINSKRELDMSTERPSKKRKIELPPTPPAQEIPDKGAVEHVFALLRGREAVPDGSVIADELSSKLGFDRLSLLVREWKQYSKSKPMVSGGFELVRSVEGPMHGYPELHTFLSRFCRMQVERSFERAAAGVEGSQHQLVDELLQLLEWDETKREDLHDYLREGRCWRNICGNDDGLLCLLPLEKDCIDLALFKDELASFHSKLDIEYVHKLSAIGNMLQKSIWECLELPEFIWESTDTTGLTADLIAPLLEPFRIIKSCYYNEGKASYWLRPAGWRWHWPADPSVVMPGDRPCDLCTSKSCRCAETRIPRIPRISDDGSKGTGIRSVGPYKTHDILGELVGELVPLGACAGDWTMTLCRPDLDDEPVADIYPRRMGNWVRKVNHSTNPSAAFMVMKISGRWRQMLVAIRDIGDGEEITAKYGRGFFKRQPYSLVEGLH